MSYIVALTGGIGSGKSTIANVFSQYGVDIIDADIIARQIVEPGKHALKEIIAHFGPQILKKDGTLNRAELRQIIFNIPSEKEWLDRLLHPLIHSETQRKIISARSPWCLWVAPLLVEYQLEKLAHQVLVIDVDPIVQIERIITRDSITREQAEKIINTQSMRDERLLVANDVVKNNGHPKELEPIVDSLHKHYLMLALEAKKFNKV